MANLTITFHPDELRDHGPRIQVAIGHSQFEQEEGQSLGLELPAALKVSALIDTGASITVINPQVAKTCRLRQTSFVLISAAGNSGEYPEYAAALSFPGTSLRTLDVVRVVACKLPHQPISCLIGRDILRRWKLLYDGPAAQISIEE